MTSPNLQLRAARERLPSPADPNTHLSRRELAELVNAWLWNESGQRFDLDRHTIGRWERGDRRWPAESYRAALRAVLGVARDDQLGFRRPRRGEPRLREQYPDVGDGDDWDRLDRALALPHGVDPAAVDHVARMLAATRELEDTTSARLVLPSVREQLAITEALGREARSGVRPSLAALASELHQYAGWLHTAIGRLDTAREQLDRAVALGVEADDPDRVAHALSFKAYAALQDDQPAAAASLSAAARRDSRVFPGLRAFDAYQQALAHAGEDDPAEAQRTLAEADRLLAAVDDDPPPSGYWYRPPFLRLQRGLVLLRLGQFPAAADDLAGGLQDMPAAERDSEWAADYKQALVQATDRETAGRRDPGGRDDPT